MIFDYFKIYFYILRGRKLGGKGSYSFGIKYISNVLSNKELMAKFASGESLPKGFGVNLSERVVEIPWVLSKISPNNRRILDAGSALNHGYIFEKGFLKDKSLVCVTLAPEESNYNHLGISYVYDDLRTLPFKDNYLDTIISISTIEHIGMDSSIYTKNPKYFKKKNDSFIDAIEEFHRVLKPEGVIMMTIPFGKYQDLIWLQQFDKYYLDKLVKAFKGKIIEETYFKYTFSGWNLSRKEECEESEYIQQDKPTFAMASSVVCLMMKKNAE